jgi:Flp pilus assembly CpaF family ATPase
MFPKNKRRKTMNTTIIKSYKESIYQGKIINIKNLIISYLKYNTDLPTNIYTEELTEYITCNYSNESMLKLLSSINKNQRKEVEKNLNLNRNNFDSIKYWYKNITELKFLNEFIKDDKINEIIVHNENFCQIEKNNKLTNISIGLKNKESIELALITLAFINNVDFNFQFPFQSFYCLIDGVSFRASIIHYSLTPKKNSKLFLRRIKTKEFKIDDFKIKLKEENLLNKIINTKKNILISGATGSGKTAFLRSLINTLSINEHIIILEDTYELISNKKNITHMLSNQLSAKNSLLSYCQYSLRLKPDRLILGELRGKEVLAFVNLLNTGHGGLMSTIHADNASNALEKTALLYTTLIGNNSIDYNKILKLLSQNINYCIHLKDKRVTEIIEILSCEEGTIYKKNHFNANEHLLSFI